MNLNLEKLAKDTEDRCLNPNVLRSEYRDIILSALKKVEVESKRDAFLGAAAECVKHGESFAPLGIVRKTTTELSAKMVQKARVGGGQ